MDFTKMHGIGNDFILADAPTGEPAADMPALARRLCNRHFGIGADGLMLVCPSEKADFAMRLWNSDGSVAEMCGNGIRCFAKYVYDRGYARSTEFTVDTLDGVKTVSVEAENGQAEFVTIGMGQPELLTARGETEVIEACGRRFSMVFMNMGVPHAVLFADELSDAEYYELGPALEAHSRFPRKANINFVRKLDEGAIIDRVWERGAGETLACGTGACASAVACHLLGLTGRSVQVILPGGTLQIEITDKEILMKGPAAKVFTGRVEV